MTTQQKVLRVLINRGVGQDRAEKIIAENLNFCLAAYENPKPAFIADFLQGVS